MKRILFILVVLAFTSCHTKGQKDSDQYGQAFDNDGITVLDLQGTWYQMGRQYGILAKSKMGDVLKYLDEKLGSDLDNVAAAAQIADKLYSNYPEYLKDFFDGVCHTSNLSLEKVKLCNAVEYVEGVFLCSAMAVWDDYADGKLVLGRNYDAASYAEIDQDLVVTVFHPNDGIPTAIVGYAGELYCVNGLNANGIFVELNNGMPSAGSEIHWDLCPSTTSLLDMLFGARNLDDVDDFFHTTQSSLSVTIGVADKNEARAYEWCYDGVRRGDETTDNGLMISTNHYVHNSWPYCLPDDDSSWNSVTRRCNLLATAQQYKGRIDVEKMKEIMSTSIDDGGPAHDLTRYQIVAVPEDKTLFILVPTIGEWVEINLDRFF